MTERTPPAWLQAGSHPADLDRLLIETLIPTAGVRDVAGGELAVTEQATPAMGVTIAAGYVIIDGTESTSQGHYGAYNDGAVDLAVAASDPSNPRIDLVVARVYDSFYGVAGSDTWALEVVTGTAEASPSEPAVPDNAEVIARVDVPAGAASIGNAEITDRRTQAAMRSPLIDAGITSSPIAAMFDLKQDSTQVNAAMDTTKTAKFTLSFPDPGGPVRVIVFGWARGQRTGGSTENFFLDAAIDGDEPAENTGQVLEAAGSHHASIGHAREWTPSGAFDVELFLWGTTTNAQHLASGVWAVMLPAGP